MVLKSPRVVSDPTKRDDFHLEILNRSSLFHHLLDSDAPFDAPAATPWSPPAIGPGESFRPEPEDAAVIGVVILLLFFVLVEMAGILGNCLVLLAVLADEEMRGSSINLLIVNLAASDLWLALTGILEAVVVIGNGGWMFSDWACKLERFSLVASIHSSSLTLALVSIERFVAIVHPLRGHHVICKPKRAMMSILLILILSAGGSLPVLIFNQVVKSHPSDSHYRCRLEIHGRANLLGYKLSESVVFFLVPTAIQIILYGLLARKLIFVSKKYRLLPCWMAGKLRLKGMIPSQAVEEANADDMANDTADDTADDTVENDESDKTKSHREFVMAMIACTAAFVISYLPQQVQIFYMLITGREFKVTRALLLVSLATCYVNFSLKPILYATFSRKFRSRFAHLLTCRFLRSEEQLPVSFSDEHVGCRRGSVSFKRRTLVAANWNLSESNRVNLTSTDSSHGMAQSIPGLESRRDSSQVGSHFAPSTSLES